MYVSASTACFPENSLAEAIEYAMDLEFTCIEISLDDRLPQMPTARLETEFNECLRLVRDTHRLDICAYDVFIDLPRPQYYDRFKLICQFAKATKVVTLAVPSAELGTPFNEEVEHLQKLVDIAETEGVRVGMKSQAGCLTEDPDTVKVLCDNVHGLGLTFDPSHYHITNHRNKNLEKIMKYVFLVQLRDSKKDQLQVRIGQGEMDYGKYITMLQRVGYDQALNVDMRPAEGLDMRQEMRKLRLLLESML